LADSGIAASVVDVRSLNPLDVPTICTEVSRTGRAVIVQEAPYTGGFAGEIAATIQAECFYDLEAPVLRVSAPDTPYPLAAVEDLYLPTVSRLVSETRDLMEVRA
jgi:pyruvate dehydrogenase E1 component beta subunit